MDRHGCHVRYIRRDSYCNHFTLNNMDMDMVKLWMAKNVWGFNPDAKTGSCYERYNEMRAKHKASLRDAKQFNRVFLNAKKQLSVRRSI